MPRKRYRQIGPSIGVNLGQMLQAMGDTGAVEATPVYTPEEQAAAGNAALGLGETPKTDAITVGGKTYTPPQRQIYKAPGMFNETGKRLAAQLNASEMARPGEFYDFLKRQGVQTDVAKEMADYGQKLTKENEFLRSAIKHFDEAGVIPTPENMKEFTALYNEDAAGRITRKTEAVRTGFEAEGAKNILDRDTAEEKALIQQITSSPRIELEEAKAKDALAQHPAQVALKNLENIVGKEQLQQVLEQLTSTSPQERTNLNRLLFKSKVSEAEKAPLLQSINIARSRFQSMYPGSIAQDVLGILPSIVGPPKNSTAGLDPLSILTQQINAKQATPGSKGTPIIPSQNTMPEAGQFDEEGRVFIPGYGWIKRD